jgi:hypothetical protein
MQLKSANGGVMTEGVLYYNRGTRFLPRLAVSLRSLRRNYTGAVSVVAEGGLPSWFKPITERFYVNEVSVPASSEYHLAFKAGLWRHSPFDHTVFIDADTIIQGSIEPLFKAVNERGFVVTNFNGWVTTGRKIRRRIDDWKKVDSALANAASLVKHAINTGVMGWRKGNPLLPETEKLARRGLEAGCSRVTLDELAMQMLLPSHAHAMMGPEYNTGAVHGDGSKAVIVHYHGDKHCNRDTPNCALWKAEFEGLLADFPDLSSTLNGGCGDGRLAEWRAEASGRLRDMTIVTAVNPEYAEKLKINLAKWMATGGLKQQQFLVFVNGFKNAKDRAFLNLPNVRVVRWDYPHGERRERMLAAFVLGTAEHVKTAYWMKLDGDTAPTQSEFKWPDYQRYTVISHKWGYTKMKGDDGAKRHWFNRLDDVFSPGAPMFQRNFDIKKDFKISHRSGEGENIPMRFASFAHIEKTEFTRRIADTVRTRCGGRLPIPSHDTLAWYCSALWNEKVKLTNMKEWFNPRG